MYHTAKFKFSEDISRIDKTFKELYWGVDSLKEWIDSYESVRFTQTSADEAFITYEYNGEYVENWLQEHNIGYSIILQYPSKQSLNS
jgi:hypothetical protein